MALKTDDEQPFLGYEMTQGRDYSEATAALIDNDVHRRLAEQYDSVVELLTGQRELLDRLVQKLLQEETVDQEALTNLLGARAQGMFEELPGERPTEAIQPPRDSWSAAMIEGESHAGRAHPTAALSPALPCRSRWPGGGRRDRANGVVVALAPGPSPADRRADPSVMIV